MIKSESPFLHYASNDNNKRIKQRNYDSRHYVSRNFNTHRFIVPVPLLIFFLLKLHTTNSYSIHPFSVLLYIKSKSLIHFNFFGEHFNALFINIFHVFGEYFHEKMFDRAFYRIRLLLL